jgi:hypothetical protein
LLREKDEEEKEEESSSARCTIRRPKKAAINLRGFSDVFEDFCGGRWRRSTKRRRRLFYSR